MSDIKISLIFPARSRIDLLDAIFDKTMSRAKYPDTIEYCVGIDHNDDSLREALVDKCNRFNVQLLVSPNDVNDKNKNIHSSYYAPLSQMAKGKYVWGIGNDVEVTTENWDEILEAEIEAFLADKPDRLLYGFINHGTLNPGNMQNSSGFPVFTKEHCETVGTTVPIEINSWGADREIFEIYNGLCESRMLHLEQKVFVQHWSYHTNSRHSDDVSFGLCTTRTGLSHEERMSYINRLNARIHQFKVNG